MIKNVHKAVTDYAAAYKQATKIYKQAEKHIKANYKEDSDLYKSAMKTAKNTLNEAVTPIKDNCVAQVQKDFDEARKAIGKAVVEPYSSDMISILPMIKEGKLDDVELQIIMDQHKGNYMDMKLIHDAMGKPFTTVKEVMERLDSLEAGVIKYFRSYKGEEMDRVSYENALMMNGSVIGSVNTLTDDFLSAYAGQPFSGNGSVDNPSNSVGGNVIESHEITDTDD